MDAWSYEDGQMNECCLCVGVKPYGASSRYFGDSISGYESKMKIKMIHSAT